MVGKWIYAIAPLALCLSACDRAATSLTIESGSSPSESGQVTLSLNLGQVGMLGRAAEMTPSRLVLAFTSARSATVRDTITLSGSGLVSKSYSLASQQGWTVLATGLDQRDSVLYSGSQSFQVLAKKNTNASLSLDARFSSLRVRFPVRDSLTRFVLSVDGQVWGDSSVAKQSRVGDTVKMDRDYLPASQTGTAHAFSLRVYGQPWDVDTLLYALDTTLSVVSGSNAGRALVMKWVGPKTPPPGKATLAVTLGAVGLLDIAVGYEDTGASQGLFTDLRDGHLYKWVKIAGQKWMAENLAFKPESDSSWWFGDDSLTRFPHGRLYPWATAMALPISCAEASCAGFEGRRGICPTGWHIPSRLEWLNLSVALGDSLVAGQSMKAKAPDFDGTDASGFHAMQSGMRWHNGTFIGSNAAYYWSSSEESASWPQRSFSVRLFQGTSVLDYDATTRNHGLSVRCIAD